MDIGVIIINPNARIYTQPVEELVNAVDVVTHSVVVAVTINVAVNHLLETIVTINRPNALITLSVRRGVGTEMKKPIASTKGISVYTKKQRVMLS